jgi:hypothetical protein
MGRRRASRPPRRGTWLVGVLGLVGLVVTVAVVSAGVASTPEAPPEPPSQAATTESTPSPSPTPDPGSLDVSNLPVERGPFCDQVDDSAAATALGEEVSTRDHYGNGDRVRLAPGVTDVSHEYGCVFRAGDAEARAWVFAPPVSTAEARRLVREARSEPGCDVESTGRFGRPSVTTVCERGDGPGAVVTMAGLFGDAWLTCRLTDDAADSVETGDDGEVLTRAESWCLHVVTTVGARP